MRTEEVKNQHLKLQNALEGKRRSKYVNKVFFLGALFTVVLVGGILGQAGGDKTVLSSQKVDHVDICLNVTVGEKVKSSSSDYISVVFDVEPTKADCHAFMNAASKLSKAIAATKNDYNVTLPQDFSLKEVCGITGNNNPPMLKQGENIQDLVIAAVLQSVDGENGVLGYAAPCIINPNNGLTLAGVIFFDTADTALMEESGILGKVVLHEMMHVLGYGLNWTPRIGPGGNLVSNFSVAEDQVLTYDDNGEIIVQPENEPIYTGDEGIAEFEKLTGKEESFIPLQGVELHGDPDFFNVSAGEGRGQVDVHIDKDTFQNALMTYGIDPEAGKEVSLTVMSLAMLRDIGYTVNTSVGDEYILPPNPWNSVSKLRGSRMDFIDLSTDLLSIEPIVLDFDYPSALKQLRSREMVSLKQALGLV
eukprot:maker-scaffold_6-snap-gene-5.43-mRNA-1 protein AED:0.00 eAED:0.00 QI:204/1/1/1/1/1/2/42/418